jgi:hypothetical protein
MSLPQFSRRHFLKTSAGVALLGAASQPLGVRPARAAAPSLSSPNEVIQKARDVALGILKPSQKGRVAQIILD